MLTDDGKHLYVSWDEYHMLIERLALKVHASGWEFDQILCLARGGMRPGDVLSRVFDKPLAAFQIPQQKLANMATEITKSQLLNLHLGRMKDAGHAIEWGPGRHGPGDNAFNYFIDPFGIVIEYTAEVEQIDDDGMIWFCIYSRAGSFVCRFETYEKAERWKRFMGPQDFTIRKEVW